MTPDDTSPATASAAAALEAAARAADADLPTGPATTELVRTMFDTIAPRYDLEKQLPAVMDPLPTVVTMAGRQDNPAYQPPPPEFNEKYPWVIYLVLSVACAVLAFLLFRLGRESRKQPRLRTPCSSRSGR